MFNWLIFIGLCCTQLSLGLDPVLPRVCPNIVSRSQWNAIDPIGIEYVIIPVKNVIIHHTVTDECYTQENCSQTMRNIQTFHMDAMDFYDIGYNFLIGGDGNVYEGVGWHKVGAHTRGYNTRSLGIAFIGTFSSQLPNNKMLQALRDLLACGVELGELDQNYKMFGARQVSGTASPGKLLNNEIQQWPHFSINPLS